jgi:hypothetical protein
MPADSRQTLLLIDRIGYSCYRRADGSKFFPSGQYRVAVITDRAKVGEVSGDEITLAVGIDIDDVPLMTATAEMVHRSIGIDAIVAISERLLLPAARLRDSLGISGISEQLTLLLRNKVKMKEHLSSHGIRVPDFAPCTLDNATRLLSQHGRVVLKPTEGMSSIGVYVIDNVTQLEQVLNCQAHLDSGNYEVEEYIDGTLHHVDSIVERGEPRAATVSRTIDPTTSYLSGAPCRDLNVEPGKVRDELLAFNAAVIRCYPWFSGAMHHEMFVDTAGAVVFCEIAGRPGGGGVIPSFRYQTGVDLNEAAVMAQLSRALPTPEQRTQELSGYVMIYHPAGRLAAAPPAPDEPWLLSLEYLRRVGDVLPAPTRWSEAIAEATVIGKSETEVLDRLNRMARHVLASASTTALDGYR